VKGSPAGAPAVAHVEIGFRFAAAATPGRLQVKVDTPAGDSEWQEVDLPLGGAEAERLAHRALLGASRGRTGAEPARHLGQALYGSLFAPQVLGRFHATIGATRSGAPPLRLRFHLGSASAEEAALHRLPWELLCEPGLGGGRLLALDRNLSVVRHLTVPGGGDRPPRPPRLRVLVAAAEGRAPGEGGGLGLDGTALDGTALDVGGEVDSIRAACRQTPAVAVEVLRPATLDRLIERLRGGDYHVLHLIGHGDLVSGDGVVLLPDADGRLVPWHGERLAAQLDGLSPLRLVVLNACRTAEAVAGRPFSGVAGAFLARGMPAVVAMQAPITDVAAAAFATTVYRRLAAGAGLDAAVSEGRLAISRRRPHTFEWAVPVLFSRLSRGDLFAAPAVERGTEAAASTEAETAAPVAAGAGRPGGSKAVASVAAGSSGPGASGEAAATDVMPRRRRVLLALASFAVFLAAALAGSWLAPETSGRERAVPGDPVADRSGAVAVHPGDVRAEPSPAEAASPRQRPGRESAREAGDAVPPVVGLPGVVLPAEGRPGERRRVEGAPRGDTAFTPFCGPIRTLRSGEAVEIPEIGATLVPRVLDEPGLGPYVTLALLGLAVPAQDTTNRPDTLDFRGQAPLVVRVLEFDADAGIVRLSCHLDE
jgi:hypothetical protein